MTKLPAFSRTSFRVQAPPLPTASRKPQAAASRKPQAACAACARRGLGQGQLREGLFGEEHRGCGRRFRPPFGIRSVEKSSTWKGAEAFCWANLDFEKAKKPPGGFVQAKQKHSHTLALAPALFPTLPTKAFPARANSIGFLSGMFVLVFPLAGVSSTPRPRTGALLSAAGCHWRSGQDRDIHRRSSTRHHAWRYVTSILGPPVVPFYPFWGRVTQLK